MCLFLIEIFSIMSEILINKLKDHLYSFDVFLCCDQPATCPKCGSRTNIFGDVRIEQKEKSTTIQLNECPNEQCKYIFVLESDSDIDNP